MTAFEVLRGIDYPLLRTLNVDVSAPILDQFWLTITQLHKLWWMQYLVLPALLVMLFAKFRAQALKPLLMVGVAVLITDTFSYRVIKSAVGRPRPFDNPEISSWVRKVGQAHGSSFPSNHAANCFAAAGVLAYYFARARRFVYTLAILIALSRPALGVHYPSDVAAGALIGAIVAFFVSALIIARVPELAMFKPETNKAGQWRKRFDQPG